MLAYTAINVPYSALLAVISPIASERTKATQFRFVFASLGTLSVGAFASPLVNWLGAGDELQGFQTHHYSVRNIVGFTLLDYLRNNSRERVQPKAP